MSQLLQSGAECCRPCPEPVVENIPGPQGPAGANGTNGTNGVNAYSETTDTFVMPAEGGNVDIAVADSTWMVVGENVVVGKFGSAAFGTFEVISKADSTHATVQNIADTATGKYINNSAPATVFPTASLVGPSGLQGPKGADGVSGAPTDATYITQTPNGTLTNEQPLSALATGLLYSTTGTGVVSIKTVGIAASNIPPVDAGAALTAGQVVQVVAGGLKSDTAANTRTLLGLGSMAVQAAGAVAITGGTLSGVAITASTGSFTTLVMSTSFARTPSALQTLAAANLIVYAPKVRVAGSGGAVTMTSTPTLSTGTVDGQECLIQGTDNTNTVTLQDNGSLAGSKLKLGAASRVLGSGDTLLLSWDSTLGMWCEVAFTNVV